MLDKRNQGRPKQGEMQVGRDRIVSGFVEMVRSGSSGDVSRKEIAQFVGITPALITYYFPKGHLLLIDTFSNVFSNWYDQIDNILSGDGDYDSRLTEALRMIVEFYRREYYVELLYADLCRKGILGDSIVDRMRRRLGCFLAEDSAISGPDIETSEILANVIWGACQQGARLDHSEALYDIVRRVAAPRPRSDRGATKRPVMAQGGIEGSASIGLPMTQRMVEQRRRFSSTPSIETRSDATRRRL